MACKSLWRIATIHYHMNDRPYEYTPTWALNAMLPAYREASYEREMIAVQDELDRRLFTEASDSAWYAHFTMSMRSEKRASPEGEAWTAVAEQDVLRPFSADGKLAELMPGYEPRDGQVSMAREVIRALNRPGHLMVEAGTGVGKSLGYLVPVSLYAYMNSVPIVVSTNTRNLQTQLIEKDAPVVKQILVQYERSGEPFKVAVLKGRANYLCLKTFGELLEGNVANLDHPNLPGYAEAVLWSTVTRDGDLDTLQATAKHIDASFVRQLGCTGEDCSGRGCRFYKRCFMQKARQRAAEAHVIIANHALVFAEMSVPGCALPPYAQVIFDEAHNLEEAATQFLSMSVSPYGLFSLCQRIAPTGKVIANRGVLEQIRKSVLDGRTPPNEAKRNDLISLLADIRTGISVLAKEGAALFALLYAFVDAAHGESIRYRSIPDPDRPVPAGVTPFFKREVSLKGKFVDAESILPEEKIDAAKGKINDLLVSLDNLFVRLDDAIDAATPPDEDVSYSDVQASASNAAGGLKAFGEVLNRVLAGADVAFVYWLEKWGSKDKQIVLTGAPLSIADQLQKRLYADKRSVIFSSATLQVRQSYDHISHRLGADLIQEGGLMTYTAESPFDYPNQCSICVPTFLPDPPGGSSDDSTYVLELSRLMYRLFTHAKGRSLGLFTSYEMMTAAARYLEKPLADKGIKLLIQSASNSRDAITQTFRANEEACVLFGTQSFWEGVDISGDALSCVVIARLPFGAFNDPLFEARCDKIRSEGGSPFIELNLPQAVIRFRQGFGRLIRSRKDRGIVVVADSRMINKSYGMSFQKALPAPVRRVTDHRALLAELHQRIDPI